MTLSPVAEVMVVVLANLVVAWLLTYLLHSSVVIGLAWWVERLRGERALPERRLAPADRALLWRLAIFGPPLSAGGHLALGPDRLPWSLEPRMLSGVLASSTELSIGIAALLLLAPLVLVSVLMLGWVRLRVAIGPRQAASRESFALLARVSLATHRSAPLLLTASPRLLAPAAVGTREICLPAVCFDELPSEEREALLAHELGHLERRDPVWLGLASALAALFWMQPLNRLALRRLRAACELAADDYAVRATGDAGALARALASVATVLVALVGSASAAGSPVVGRIARLLSEDRGAEPRVTSGGHSGLLAAGVLVVASLAGAPGVGISVDRAANAISWLAPSRLPPNLRMQEMLRFDRQLRDVLRGSYRPADVSLDVDVMVKVPEPAPPSRAPDLRQK